MRPALLALLVTTCSACATSTLPESLADAEFWGLVGTLSEPAGTFDLSDNLVSNEPLFVENVRRLRGGDGVYIGVGPEQNFSYIARVRPAMAFVIDIRRENLDLHLLYKALFELANDRADFVSRLFSRPRPAGLGPSSTVEELFVQFAAAAPSPERFDETLRQVRERLTVTRALPLTPADLEAIERALAAFSTDGPNIDFWRGKPKDPEAIRPTYRQLMTARDVTGVLRSFLATEEAFAYVKRMQTRNLVVPVVGDFAGPTAIRRTGEYVRSRGASVGVFYGSNVSVYLNSQEMRAFCSNLASLPAAPAAVFVDREDVKSLAEKTRTCH